MPVTKGRSINKPPYKAYFEAEQRRATGLEQRVAELEAELAETRDRLVSAEQAAMRGDAEIKAARLDALKAAVALIDG